ncbi:MAG: hypothetical protein IPJ69_01705 [Deltaproteobacteria bacterium]|nr:MAG: hypothetical protein IPJ69_01705 [Deltaproteobacteria bacterium]
MKSFLVVIVMLISTISFAESKETYSVDSLCTGIGESKLDPKNNLYPAKVIFASTSRDLYTDIHVTVSKSDGTFVAKIFCDAAWLLMKLDPGTYQIKGVDQKNLERSCQLTVKSSGQSQCVLVWPEL